MNKKDYHNIRSLAQRWYAGTATPKEENELIDFFTSAAPSDLPSDLVNDAAVFRAIGLRKSSMASMADTALLAEIEAAVEAEDTPAHIDRFTGHFRIGFWMSASAAAIVAAILVFGFLYPQPMKDSSPTAGPTTAVTTEKKNTVDDHRNNGDTESISDNQDISRENTLKTQKEKPSAPQTERRPNKNHDIVFIDDPAVGAELLAEVDCRLRNIDRAAQSALKRTASSGPEIPSDLRHRLPRIDHIIHQATSNITLPTI